MAKPSFEMMWAAFPDHDKYPTLRDLFAWLGGGLARNINEPGFGPNGNTCAARMSRALNYGNHPIRGKTAKALALNPLMGIDKKHMSQWEGHVCASVDFRVSHQPTWRVSGDILGTQSAEL